MKVLRCAVAAATVLCAFSAYAHHSPFLFFDPSTTIEIDGELVSVQWRNPHVMFEVKTADGVNWTVEANAVSILRRMNLTPDSVREGDQVSIAGWPAQRGGDRLAGGAESDDEDARFGGRPVLRRRRRGASSHRDLQKNARLSTRSNGAIDRVVAGDGGVQALEERQLVNNASPVVEFRQ